MKFTKARLIDFTFVVFLITTIFLVAHYTLIDQLGFFRKIYGVQAQIVKLTIRCSDNAPSWMKDNISYMISKNKILSNQLAYISPEGRRFTCFSGWSGHFLFSKLNNENTQYRYASLSKIITHDAILRMVASESLFLDQKIIDVFPELKQSVFKDERVKDITIANLLQHRSGFDRLKSEDVMFSTNKEPWCPYEIMQLENITLDFKPDEYYAYDNRNTCLLSAILERKSGEDYRGHIDSKYTLSKYGIGFIDGPYKINEVKYDFRNGELWTENYYKSFDFNALSSSAGLVGGAMSLADLVNNKILINSDIFEISNNALKTCTLNEVNSCNGYVFQVFQERLDDPYFYYRSGALPGVNSFLVVSEHNDVVVWVGNANNTLSQKEIAGLFINNLF